VTLPQKTPTKSGLWCGASKEAPGKISTPYLKNQYSLGTWEYYNKQL